MASASFHFPSLLAPLQMFAAWLAPRPVQRPAALRPGSASPQACGLRPVVRAASVVRPTVKPLRVVRVFDGPRARADAGRMVISGRMSDVCAELDRLAALEAAGQ